MLKFSEFAIKEAHSLFKQQFKNNITKLSPYEEPFEGKQRYHNPIPQDNNLPDEDSDEYEKLRDGVNNAIKNNKYSIKKVPIHQVKSYQPYIDGAELGKRGSGLPTAIKRGDGYTVLDGNHRVAMKKITNQSHVNLKVWNHENA